MPDAREFTVTTPLGDALLFAALEGGDEIGRPFAYTLTLLGEDADIEAAKLLGKPVTVKISRGERFFNGLVSRFAFTGFREDLAEYQVVLRPWLWFLSTTEGNRIFQNLSTVEIVEKVFSAYPEAKFDKRLQKSYPPREYCVQYGESDLDFVQRLMEEEGISYHFEHDDGEHRLILTDGNAQFRPQPRFEELDWQPDALASFEDGDFITGWAPRAQVMTGTWTQTDYDFEKPSADLMTKSAEPLGHAGDAGESYVYPGAYLELGRGDTLAAIRREAAQAAHVRVAARGTVRGLWSGATFKFKGFPRAAENGEYLVVAARYTVWDDQYRSGERRIEGFETAMELQPVALPFRPERRTPRPAMKGPQTAVVVGPAGEEIFTDEYSRVKVQFHWDREGKRDENTTCFIRVSAAWAGAGWGFIQIPRIGQEVIVDFLEGNPDWPIVTGRVYNAEQMPPYGLPGNATQSGWKSNSSPGGGGWNELRFEDKAGSEEVYFQAQKDHNELVKNDETRAIGHDWKEDVGNDATQSVGRDRTESVGNDKSTTVKMNRKVKIGVNDTEEVGGDRSLSVDGNETIKIGKNSKEEIEMLHTQVVGLAQKILVKAGRSDQVGLAESRVVGAWQTITVGKKRDVKVGGSQMHYVQASDKYEVKGDQTTIIHKNHSVDVTGNQGLKLKGNQSFDITGGRLIKVAKGQTHDVAEDVWIKAGKTMKIEAKDSITIECGDAKIEMKKDGTITIKGKDLTMQASGKINQKADGDMTVKAAKIHQN